MKNKVLAISCLNQISSQHHNFPGHCRQYGTKLRVQREQQRSEIASQLLSKCNLERRVSNGFDLHGNKSHIHTGSKSAPEPSKKLGNAADVSIRSVMASAAGAAALGGHLAGKVIDPFRLMEPQLRSLTENLKTLASADNKVLDTVSRYFFDVPGKRFRPALVLLVAQVGCWALPSPSSSLTSLCLAFPPSLLSSSPPLLLMCSAGEPASRGDLK